MRRLALPAALAALAALLLWAPQALGHAAFVSSDPAPGQRLEESPGRVVLSFTEPLNHRLSRATLTPADGGARIAVTVRPAGARKVAIVPPPALERGAYRVEWHAVSTRDAHALTGAFSFGVRAPATSSAGLVGEGPLARDGWLRIVARAALYASVLLLVAALLVPLLVGGRWPVPELPAGTADEPAVRRRARQVTDDVAWLAVGTAVGAILAETANAAGGLWPADLADFLLTSAAGFGRVLVVVALVACALTYERRPRAGAALAVLALGGIAASGHAGSASPRVPSVLNDWLHLVAAAAWLGGIVLLAIVWAPTLRAAARPARTAIARHVLAPFGRVALPAFLLVAATGIVSLVTQLGRLDALWRTDYGRLLALKIAVVGLIAAASAVHALRLRPRLLADDPHAPAALERRHWRLLRTEPWLGAGVVALVAVLVAFPLPPRQLDEAGEARAAAPACDPCPLPAAAADELPVAGNAGSQLVAAWVRRSRQAVTGTVRVLDRRGQPSGVPVELPGAESSPCGRGCRRFRLPAATDTVAVAVRERGRRHAVALPARWDQDGGDRARRLLTRAETVMRGLAGVRESERVSSGPGTLAVTEYRLSAPDRMRFRTGGGVEGVVVGRRQWIRARDSAWQAQPYGSGLPFRTRSWFRWRVYGRAVRLLTADRRVAELAVMDESTPVWFRLRVDLATHRVVSEQMTARARYVTTRFADFDRPAAIAPPRGS